MEFRAFIWAGFAAAVLGGVLVASTTRADNRHTTIQCTYPKGQTVTAAVAPIGYTLERGDSHMALELLFGAEGQDAAALQNIINGADQRPECSVDTRRSPKFQGELAAVRPRYTRHMQDGSPAQAEMSLRFVRR